MQKATEKFVVLTVSLAAIGWIAFVAWIAGLIVRALMKYLGT